MARRAVALGVGLVVLILLVFGAKGCLDARKNRSLEDYASSVTQIVDETNSLSKSFFGLLEDPQDLGVPDYVSEVESDRSAMDGFLSRVEKLDTPGDMKAAQSNLLLTYQLRAGAMNIIAERMPTATGNEGKKAAINAIAKQMEVLAASDILYNQVVRHQIDNTIESNGASAPAMPKSTFVPDVAFWVDSENITSSLGKISGATSTDAATDGKTHGTGLDTATIGATTLDAAAPVTIPAGTDPAVVVSVTNQGDADESDIEVSVSVDGGTPITSTIDSLAAGETGQATVQITPTPTGEVTLDVAVAGVDGEQILENNEASYQVIFP
ncbi:MAG TPA: CARDB domain-containing protein [Solirubrobacterales bacterium]|nr:CARDB domain-containing protein [Solirubrobacterales bacterium]